eukprot:m.412814 g.412814  ORF g.412814 m.412814 type:complete len:337 (-) comp56570_c0_seq2:503-1513(-)
MPFAHRAKGLQKLLKKISSRGGQIAHDASLRVDGLAAVSHERSLAERLGLCRVSVADTSEVLSRGAILQRQSSLIDQLASNSVDHVDTQQAISLLVCQHLDETLSLLVASSTAVGGHQEGTNLVFDALGLQLLLRLTNPSDFGGCVEYGRHAVVVDVRLATKNSLNAENTLILGLVRQHRSVNDVTNRVDVGDVGLEVVVNLDPVLLQSDAELLDTEVLEVRPATNADKQHVSVDFSRGSVLGVLCLDLDGAVSLSGGANNLGVKLKVEALSLEDGLELLGHIQVNAWTTNVRQELDAGHLGAQTRPHRAQLEPNHTSTDHNHAFGNLSQAESTSR